jgi:hypothetical protein
MIRYPVPGVVVALLSLAAGAAAAGGAVELPALEAQLRAAPLFQGQAAAAADGAGPAHGRWGGVRAYGSGGLASVDDVIDVGRSRHYDQATATAGLMWPLLGSRMRAEEESSGRELSWLELRLDAETRRRRALSDLRRLYIEYWTAQQHERLAADFLAVQPKLAGVLRERTAAGLLLDSDRLEFLSALDRVEVERLEARASQAAMRASLQELLARDLPEGQVERPRLETVCRDFPGAVDSHPELQWLHALAVQAQGSPRSSSLYPWRSDLRIGYTRSRESETGQIGGAGVISWSFDYALGERELWRADRARARVRSARASEDYEQRRLALQDELRRIGTREMIARESLRIAQRARAAGDARVREREQRAQQLPGDVIEQLQQARYQQYRAATAQLDAEASVYAAQNAWTGFVPADCQAATPGAGRGLYLWSSAPFLDALNADDAEPLLARLAHAGLKRVYLALDAVQIEHAAEDQRPLRTALEAARRQGLRVELLLGEPSWILPAGRARLLDAIESLRGMPFAGLHLDLEPSQLDPAGGPGTQFLPELLATLRAVSERSEWPLGLSVHPRDLAIDVSGQPFAAQLQDLGIEPTLMIYLSDPQRVAAAADAVLRSWPRLRAHVAVSTEPELPAAESLASLPLAERERRLQLIETALAGRNFDGLVIQPARSWLYEPN